MACSHRCYSVNQCGDLFGSSGAQPVDGSGGGGDLHNCLVFWKSAQRLGDARRQCFARLLCAARFSYDA